MKVSKRDVGLLLGLLGLVAVFFCYQFVYTKNMEKKESLERQLSSLQTTEAQLKNLEDNMEHYKSEITRMEGENEEILALYPSNILPENEIMYAVELEENNEIYFTNLNYGSANVISTGYEDKTNIKGYELVMSMNYQSTYNGLKNAIIFNKSQNDRMVINSVSAAFDSRSGELSGSMSLSQYFIDGTDKLYKEPYVPSMKTGLSNIFGSLSK